VDRTRLLNSEPVGSQNFDLNCSNFEAKMVMVGPLWTRTKSTGLHG
jgi:hypothetical protein